MVLTFITRITQVRDKKRTADGKEKIYYLGMVKIANTKLANYIGREVEIEIRDAPKE